MSDTDRQGTAAQGRDAQAADSWNARVAAQREARANQAKPPRRKARGPRSQHAILMGLTPEEFADVARAAEQCEARPTTFARAAVLEFARRVLAGQEP